MRSYFTPQGNFYNESHRFAVGRAWLSETEHSGVLQSILDAAIAYAAGGTGRTAEVTLYPGNYRVAARTRMNPQTQPTSAVKVHAQGAIIAPHRAFPATTTELLDLNNAPNGRTPQSFSGSITLSNVARGDGLIGGTPLTRTGGAAAPTVGSWWMLGDDSTLFYAGAATATKFRAFPVQITAVDGNNINIDVACPWPLTTTPKLWPLAADASFGVQLLGLRFSGLYQDGTTRLDTPMRGYYLVNPVFTDYEADDILESGFQVFSCRGGLETNSRFILNDPVTPPSAGTRRGSDVYWSYGWYRDTLYGEHTRHLCQSSGNASMTTRNGSCPNAWSASYDDHGNGSYDCLWELGTFTQNPSATDLTGAKQGNESYCAEEFYNTWRDLTLNGCDLYCQAGVNCTFLRINARALGIGGFTSVPQGNTYPRDNTYTDCFFSRNDAIHLGPGNSYKRATGQVLTYCVFIETAAGSSSCMQADIVNGASDYTFNTCLFDVNLATNKHGFMQWASVGGSSAWTLTWNQCVFAHGNGSTGKSLNFNSANSPTGTWNMSGNVQRGNGASFLRSAAGSGLTYGTDAGNVAADLALSTPANIAAGKAAIDAAISAGANP